MFLFKRICPLSVQWYQRMASVELRFKILFLQEYIFLFHVLEYCLVYRSIFVCVCVCFSSKARIFCLMVCIVFWVLRISHKALKENKKQKFLWKVHCTIINDVSCPTPRRGEENWLRWSGTRSSRVTLLRLPLLAIIGVGSVMRRQRSQLCPRRERG